MDDGLKTKIKRNRKGSPVVEQGLPYTNGGLYECMITHFSSEWISSEKLLHFAATICSRIGEILSEYLLSYRTLTDKLECLDRRIEELASQEAYQESVKKLSCFLGIKTQIALATIVEVGDFRRFPSAQRFAAYLGLVPGEDSSGESQKRIGITKAGNAHVRRLLVEAAQSYVRGQVGYQSVALKKRQEGNTPEVIAYADRANERLRRKYYKMVLSQGKRSNVAKTAVARELACFIWGVMTGNVA